MTRSTVILLVCLRLAIGWHFTVEGWSKVRSTDLTGPSETTKPFNSDGYLRENPGPLARLMKSQLGDPDEKLLAFLTLQPMPPDVDPAKYPGQNRVPLALAKEWDDYFERFSAHYQLDAGQKSLCEAKLIQAKHNLVVWLTIGEVETKADFPTGTVERTKLASDRVADYRSKVDALRDILDKKLYAFGKDVEKQHLQELKGQVVSLRKELAGHLDAKTAEYHKTLEDMLTKEQAKLRPLVEAPDNASDFTKKIRRAVRGSWRDDPAKTPNPPPLTGIEIINALTRWGLLAIGLGLLAGLFTRLWCILGAGFLLMTYLAAPPMPWWPTPPQQEGTYLFVNKNVVEMLALLLLATTYSGRWFGLDALFGGWTCCSRRRARTMDNS